MRVSIAIPFYNSSKFLVETLESVKRQDYADLELLLYDDCSEDNSAFITQNWLDNNADRFTRVFFTKGLTNSGASFAADILLSNATGIYFQLLGSDDIILPSKISNQVLFLQLNNSYRMVYSNAYRIDESGDRFTENYFESQKFKNINNLHGLSGYLYDQLLVENFIPSSSFLAIKEAIISVGGYDQKIRCEDWDLWLRFSKKYEIGFMPLIDVEYRVHHNSSMQNKKSLVNMFESFLISLHKHYRINKKNDKIIISHINKYTVGMYRLGFIDLKHLLKNFYLNKSLKSLIYLLLGILRIKINQFK
jgi:glycosyltransferase involved in cell wall biosynthesis